MAGKPVTDLQNFAPHEAIESPASIPAVPFHFDHREPSPSTSKTSDKRKSLCVRMAPFYCAPNEKELPTIVIVARTGERYTS